MQPSFKTGWQIRILKDRPRRLDCQFKRHGDESYLLPAVSFFVHLRWDIAHIDPWHREPIAKIALCFLQGKLPIFSEKKRMKRKGPSAS